MIHVARSRVRFPPALRSGAARRARAEAEKFFRLRPTARAQRTFSFEPAVYAADDLISALTDLFQRKCAYCESPVRAFGPIVVDQFRPRVNALALDGEPSPDHYWWLAYEWDNLYSSCSECSTFKGSRFPTARARARAPARSTDLLREGALLLDPCVDNPEEELVFLEDGQVASSGERGRVTIEIFGLNRTALVEARRAAFAEVRAEWEVLRAALTAKRKAARPSPGQFEALFAAARPYAALRRQFVKEWTVSERGAIEKFLASTPEGPDSIEQVGGDVPVVTAKGKAEAREAHERQKAAQEAYSVAGAKASEEYFLRARVIERIVIRNFRVIKDLTLEFPPPTKPERAAWLMVLGENGHGKSSILQAVALALMGKEYRDRLKLDASAQVRRRARQGSVEVHLAGSDEPITLTFSRDSSRFGGGPSEPKVLLLGYGATRLLPRGAARPQTSASFARVDNLFNPFVPLADVNSYLLGLDGAGFARVARALKELLPVEDEAELIKNAEERRVDVKTAGTRVSLEQLSDGYQSVIALAADVMIVMSSAWSAMETAEGIVLIDELGAHLHPRWRMRIVDALRTVFPRIQFLVSTHDPLCLRGLEDGEVAVMRRDPDEGIVALTDLPPIKGLRVDQLLTSEYFGLDTTVDPALEALFNEYYALRAKPRLSAAERERHDTLRAQLAPLQVLGTTPGEDVILEAANDFVERMRSTVDVTERRELRTETKQKITAVLDRVASGRRVRA